MNSIIDNTTPLTREELATYYTASTENVSLILKSLTEKFELLLKNDDKDRDRHDSMLIALIDQTNAIAELAESNKDLTGAINALIKTVSNNQDKFTQTIASSITDVGAMSRKQMAAIKNEIFVSSKNKEDKYSISVAKEKNKWINRMASRISDLSLLSGNGEANTYKYIYSILKEKGVDVKKFAKDYRKIYPSVTTIIRACAEDKDISVLFEKTVENEINEYKSGKKTGYHVPIRTANRCPDNIRKLVSLLSPSGSASSYAFKKAEELLRENNNDILNTYIANKTRELGLKKCNMWYLISLSPTWLKTLTNLIYSTQGI